MVTVLGIFLHGAQCNLLKAERDIGIYLTRTFSLLLKLHYRYGNSTVRLERKLTRKHFIHNHTYGINIGLVVGYFASRLLGTDIVNRADGIFGHSACIAATETRYAEIGDFNGAVLQEHNILRLYVSVYNTLIMRVLKRF